MKILAVSDKESTRYYDNFKRGDLDGFDLILSCGDLNRDYLEFLVTMAHCPLLYVHGNHDDRFDTEPPGGCDCIDGRLEVVNGIRIAGLGSSYRYREGSHMYTEPQMRRRIRRLMPQIRRHGGIDILVTHAPARHLNDFDTLPHRGFECFLSLLDRYEPAYFIHGHVHLNYGYKIPQRSAYGNTEVINAWDHCIIEI